MRALVKCVNSLAIQKFWSLVNWILHGVSDFVCGTVRQSDALGNLGLKVPKKIKVEIWMSERRRLSMSRSIAAKSEQLLGLVRRAAQYHEEQYYSLRKVR